MLGLMAVASARGQIPSPTGSSRVPRWGVALAAFSGVAIAASLAVLAVAYAIGGSGATEDNWVGYLAGLSLLCGFATSLAAFALALVAAVKHERRPLLWFPLSLFPALVAFLLLGEAFLWE
jgi:hypothetical protein